ncbi:MAG: hypothetical protein AB7G37_03250 [Solirubrobacteraceae bacterium]
MLRRIAVPIVLATALALPAGASAAQRWGTIPGPLAEDAITCAEGCTIVQERYSNQGLADVLGTPPRGVVVGWRVQGEGGSARLRVVGGTAATAWAPLTGDATQPARIPVAPGQQVGVDLAAGASVAFVPAAFPSDADLVRTWAPSLASGAGTGGGTTRQGYAGLELDIEPDADGDRLGDETQDPDGGRGTPAPGPGSDPTPGSPGPAQTPQGGDAPPTSGPPSPSPPVGKAVPKSGPRVTLPKAPTATSAGVVTVSIANPYRQRLTGTLRARHGKRGAGSAKVRIPAGKTVKVKLRLSKATRTTLKRKRKLGLRIAAALKGPSTRTRTTTRTATVRIARTAGGGKPSGGGGSQDTGPDGTYRASDGQTMVIKGGRVVSFNGSITLYCTRSKRQKLVSYSMIGDDPEPTVAADGAFAWEATKNYGFQKLKFDGRLGGGTATGKLVVEDRSPLLGTGRIEFDYCFAGKDWKLTR